MITLHAVKVVESESDDDTNKESERDAALEELEDILSADGEEDTSDGDDDDEEEDEADERQKDLNDLLEMIEDDKDSDEDSGTVKMATETWTSRDNLNSRRQ